MKLTSPQRRGTGAKLKPAAATTTPGYRNPNGQIVVRDTGAPSKQRDHQSIYELRCERCAHRYGTNGMDIKQRLCPRCSNGAPGERVPERQQATLFGASLEESPNFSA